MAFTQSFELSVSSDSILLGNYIQIKFTVDNLEGEFEGPEFHDMQVISGPNMSSSIQIINGDKTSKMTYSYHVKPLDIGSYTITPAYLITEEETKETLPFTINVYPNPENIITPPESEMNVFQFGFDDFSPFQKKKTPTPPKAPSKPKRKYKKL